MISCGSKKLYSHGVSEWSSGYTLQFLSTELFPLHNFQSGIATAGEPIHWNRGGLVKAGSTTSNRLGLAWLSNSVHFGMGATISIGHEIQLIPCAGFLSGNLKP